MLLGAVVKEYENRFGALNIEAGAAASPNESTT
jgi:hypothetical protein